MAQAWGADDAVLDSIATRETDRKVCALHLRDLTRTHPELAPPAAVTFVLQWEAVARAKMREGQQRKTARSTGGSHGMASSEGALRRGER
jgi:hypothetical protein